MLLTIAILSGLGFLISAGKLLSGSSKSIAGVHATILTISVWESCFPLAIVTICLFFVLAMYAYAQNN